MLEVERVLCQNRTNQKSTEQLFHGNRCVACVLLHTCITVYTEIIRSANEAINIKAKDLGEGGAPKFGPYRNLLLNRVYFFSSLLLEQGIEITFSLWKRGALV